MTTEVVGQYKQKATVSKEAEAEPYSLLTVAERSHLRALGVPAFWRQEGLEVLARLVLDGRKRLIHPLRQTPFNSPDLAAYILEATTERGAPYKVSPSVVSTLELHSAHPQHNTLIAVAAAQFLRHPQTGATLTESEILLVAAGLYNPYDQDGTPPIEHFSGYGTSQKGGISIASVLRDGGSHMESLPKGLVQLAAVFKMARIELGYSVGKLATSVTTATAIPVTTESLQALESGDGSVPLPPDVLMAIVAYEYAQNPASKKAYSMQEIVKIVGGTLLPLNPRTGNPFTAADLEFLEIQSGADG